MKGFGKSFFGSRRGLQQKATVEMKESGNVIFKKEN
jgi:hypothetical protein